MVIEELHPPPAYYNLDLLCEGRKMTKCTYKAFDRLNRHQRWMAKIILSQIGLFFTIPDSTTPKQ